jgi:TonB-linked SusC/RagA family outer membrane protein
MEKGTKNGTITGLDGNYTLHNVSDNSLISFSMIGFKTRDIRVNGNTTIHTSLEDDTKTLEDVIVVGYGVVKKSDLTSSITTVKGDDLKSLSTGNALYSLQGKANGVQITGSGGPGATPRVIIRGVTTVNGSDPLYVVDGVPIGTNINFLNQDDIESIEVLKDASSAAIYGTRGSNGVIMVTTRKGKAGKTKFQFNISTGFQTLDKPDLADASVYAKVFKARYENDGSTLAWNSGDNFSNTDWWDQTINKTASIQTYNLAFQGGTDRFVYSGSLGYFRQDSQYDVGYWDRITARFNMEYKFNKIVKAGIDFAPRMESWDDTPNLFSDVMRMDPTTPVYRATSEWTVNPMDNYARSYNNQVWNPVANVARQNAHSNEYGLMMNPYVTLEPVKGLTARTQFSVNARFRISDSFDPRFFIDNLEQREQSKALRNTTGWIDWNWTNTLNYMKTFDEKHNINVMGGFTMEKFAEYTLEGSREATPSNHPDLQYINAGTLNPQASGTNTYNTLTSYLGRAMYNYDSRYYITGSVRADGSSKFPQGNKYAIFPAVSLAWRVAGEKFMENQKVFSNLKVRLGWGRVGNQNIDSDAYLNLIGAGDYVFGSDASRYVGTAISMVGNNSLRWEVVEDYNLGLDMAFLNGRLEVTADVYSKESKDMLMKKENLLVLGYPMSNGEMWTNIGKMEAKGWELSVNWKDHVRDFNYEVGVNLSGVKNKAKKFVADAPLLRGGFFNDYIIRNEVGGEISRFYGYIADGIFQNQTEINNHTNNAGDLLQPDAQVGDIRFKNINHDDVLDENDKTYIGKAFPDLMVGLNTRLAYRGLDLVANFYGTIGNDIYNSAMGGFYAGTEGQNVFADAFNKAWNGEGTSNFYPRFSVNDKNLNYRRVSSFFVENGSYFRCKQLQLGYTLPKHWIEEVGIRISASVQNLFTITNYSGMDPERAATGSVVESGIDNLGYPNPRIFLFGLNLTF